MARLERTQREPGIEPVGAEVSLGEEPTEICVPSSRLGEQNEMTAIGERDLRASDRLDAKWTRGVRERERAVDAVSVCEREGGVAQTVCFGEELVGW